MLENNGDVIKPCIFPFTIKGVTYHTCTNAHDPRGKAWCSTKVDDQGNHVKGHWGHCGNGCDEESIRKQVETSLSEGKSNAVIMFF